MSDAVTAPRKVRAGARCGALRAFHRQELRKNEQVPRLRWLTRGFGLIAALLLMPTAHAATNLNVGCSWFSTPFTTSTYNVGYMDTHASYYVPRC